MTEELLREGAACYGTPAYVFDVDELRVQAERFRKYFGEETGLCFAMKANPFLTAQISEIADRIEVCSFGEFEICRELGIPRERLLISGVLKQKAELLTILEYCRGKSIYTVESVQQFHILAAWCEANNEVLHVLLRLTSGNQFGMDETTVRNLICVSDMCPFLKIDGIHYFSGTQKRSPVQLKKEFAHLKEFAKVLSKEECYEIRELEYGPGLWVPYFSEEGEALQEELLQVLSQEIKDLQDSFHITLELGRAFTAFGGYYLTTVGDVKRNNDKNYGIVDGGMHQLHYDGQIRGVYNPKIRVISKENAAQECEYTICGSLCSVNDVLCQKIRLKRLEPGDILVFEGAGAYSVTEGMALFLSHSLPGIALYSKTMGWLKVRDEQPTYLWNMAKEVEENGHITGNLKRN